MASRKNHYRHEEAARPTPICPRCGKRASETRTSRGIKAGCCGLWSWNRYPLVDLETHKARGIAHSAFDKLWRKCGIRRSRAYKLLAAELGIPRSECHMKLMDERTARRVPAAVLRIRMNLLTPHSSAGKT